MIFSGRFISSTATSGSTPNSARPRNSSPSTYLREGRPTSMRHVLPPVSPLSENVELPERPEKVRPWVAAHSDTGPPAAPSLPGAALEGAGSCAGSRLNAFRSLSNISRAFGLKSRHYRSKDPTEAIHDRRVQLANTQWA